MTGGPLGTELAEDLDHASEVEEMIRELAALSEPGAGVTRLGYSQLERRAHGLFESWMQAMGLRTWSDAAGNTIAERPGLERGLGAIGTGSHLDSVPHGGRFDGIAGVVAATLVARELDRTGVEHQHPLRFVAFAAEEGARFGQACIGSKLATAGYQESDLYEQRDVGGTSVAEAMREVGLDPAGAVEQPWDPAEWSAFVELHVEQGGVLDEQQVPIGLVDSISGSTRLELKLSGRSSHTGATPMAHRRDALAAAADIVLLAERIAGDDHHRGTRASVGHLEVYPNSMTTIAGRVTMRIDVRDVDSDRQRSTTLDLIAQARKMCARRDVRISVRVLADVSPVVLPVWIRQLLAGAAAETGYRVLTSGASHDAQLLTKIMPVGMIFVPSRGGLSHVPEEWTSPADIAYGAQVLMRAILDLDATLAGSGAGRS